MKRCLAILLVTSSLIGLCAADADDLAKEKKRLQGNWVASTIIDNGRAESEDDVKGLKLTIRGDKYVYAIGGRSLPAVYKIDPTKKPKEMDVTFKEGPQKGKTMLAIYSLEGDELKICGGDKRPSELKSKLRSEVILFVFKREKP